MKSNLDPQLVKIKTIKPKENTVLKAVDYSIFREYAKEIFINLGKKVLDPEEDIDKISYIPEIGYKIGIKEKFSKDVIIDSKRINNIKVDIEKRVISPELIKNVNNECITVLEERNKDHYDTGFTFDGVSVYFNNNKIVPLSEINTNYDFLNDYECGWDFAYYTLDKIISPFSEGKIEGFDRGYYYIKYQKEDRNLIYPIIRFEREENSIDFYLDKSFKVNGNPSFTNAIIKNTIDAIEHKFLIKPKEEEKEIEKIMNC